MTASGQSLVTRLVLFMTCLFVPGSFTASTPYPAVDPPAQQNVSS